ncbi:MAG: hypothetical protein IPH28_25365 [Cytophagaceae bacterium]|nr:hypothetical protein [Cytophagaceae bacterium]
MVKDGDVMHFRFNV